MERRKENHILLKTHDFGCWMVKLEIFHLQNLVSGNQREGFSVLQFLLFFYLLMVTFSVINIQIRNATRLQKLLIKSITWQQFGVGIISMSFLFYILSRVNFYTQLCLFAGYAQQNQGGIFWVFAQESLQAMLWRHVVPWIRSRSLIYRSFCCRLLNYFPDRVLQKKICNQTVKRY